MQQLALMATASPPHPRPAPDRAAALQRLAASNERPTWQRYLPGGALLTAVAFLGAGACECGQKDAGGAAYAPGRVRVAVPCAAVLHAAGRVCVQQPFITPFLALPQPVNTPAAGSLLGVRMRMRSHAAEAAAEEGGSALAGGGHATAAPAGASAPHPPSSPSPPPPPREGFVGLPTARVTLPGGRGSFSPVMLASKALALGSVLAVGGVGVGVAGLAWWGDVKSVRGGGVGGG